MPIWHCQPVAQGPGWLITLKTKRPSRGSKWNILEGFDSGYFLGFCFCLCVGVDKKQALREFRHLELPSSGRSFLFLPFSTWMEEEYGRFFLSNYRGAPLHFGPHESQASPGKRHESLWLSNMWLSEDLMKKIWSHMEVSCKGVTPIHHPKLE